MPAHMQTHPPTEHDHEIHVIDHITIKQTLPKASNDPIYTIHFTCPKSCCVQPFNITALSLLASVYYFVNNLSTFCLTMCPLF